VVGEHILNRITWIAYDIIVLLRGLVQWFIKEQAQWNNSILLFWSSTSSEIVSLSFVSPFLLLHQTVMYFHTHIKHCYKINDLSRRIFPYYRSIANNAISGTVPSTIWQNRTLNATEQLIL